MSLVCRGAALYCLRVKQRRQRHLLLRRSTFGHAQIPKKRKNGAVELVQSVTYPITPPAPKLIQCQHCPAKFENEQAHAVHRKILHPLVDAHEGTRLMNSMRDGRKVAMWPWEGFGMGRCWVARLGTGPEGKTVFQFQPKRLLFNDGFSCDDDKPVGRCGAGIRRVYTNREKAAAVEKLRRYQKQEDAIFTANRMTPLQFTAKTVGTAESNISKWAKGEAQIIEEAAAVVTQDLMKNHRARAWFPKAERELHVLFRAKREKGLKVSTLWLCVAMTGLIKKHSILGPKRPPRVRAMSKSGLRSSALLQGGGAPRRIRASRSASPRSSDSTSRCESSCRTRHQCLVGRTEQARGESVGLHRRGQANLRERGR